ncbi:unnamed protein product, partial [marine sediment metagenome]
LYTLPERNAIFGATLTDSEKASWESAAINAASTDAQIEAHIEMLESIYNDVMDRMQDKMRMSKWSSTFQEGIQSQRDRYSTRQGDSAPTPGSAPQGVEQSEWDGYSAAEKQEVNDYIDEYGGLPE